MAEVTGKERISEKRKSAMLKRAVAYCFASLLLFMVANSMLVTRVEILGATLLYRLSPAGRILRSRPVWAWTLPNAYQLS